jgi:hypothetical protein
MARQAWRMSGGRNVALSGEMRQRLAIPVALAKLELAAFCEIT